MADVTLEATPRSDTTISKKENDTTLEPTPRFNNPLSEIDEKALVWKISWREMLTSTLMLILALVRTPTVLELAFFFLTYILFEIPSNIVLKMVNPARWISRIMVSWGICSLCMMFVKNAVGLVLCRIFLGICEAGYFPGMVFCLSLWFTPDERAYRLSFLFGASAIAGMVGGALAYGIFFMEGIAGLHGWQWLFIIEGIPSVLMGVVVWFTLPPSPQSVSWLSDQEKLAVALRLAKFGQEKSSHKFNFRQIWPILKDYRIWVMSIVNMAILTQVYTLAFFLPAIIKDFGFSAGNANGLSVPIWFVALLAIILNALHSDHQKERAWHIIIPSFINIIFWILLGLSILPAGYNPVPNPSPHHNQTNINTPLNSTQNFEPYYNLAYQYSTTIITTSCTYSVVVILIIWVTDILKGSSQLAVGIAIITSLGNCGGFIGPLIVGSVTTSTGSYSVSAWIMAGFSTIVMLGALFLWLMRNHVPESSLVLEMVTDEMDLKKEKEKKQLFGWKKVMHTIFVG